MGSCCTTICHFHEFVAVDVVFMIVKHETLDQQEQRVVHTGGDDVRKQACLFEQTLHAFPVFIGFFYVGWVKRWHSKKEMVFSILENIIYDFFHKIQLIFYFAKRKMIKYVFYYSFL